ncbi:GNAT family N-acetyltransferase [uncultured Nitratireductor sp.]|uniref:GNAT family N-acetyltransferase n=1 Tax=uncultured Nitratireductor sp. TaxID=520953 RepID=UPI0025F3B006|nr:GNAT family N-acetyltransferase [uncultured Nitratireductor sp.]
MRDFERADVSALTAYQSDPRFVSARESAGQDAGDPAELVTLFRKWAQERPRRNYQFAVIERKSGHLVGCAGLRTANCPQGNGELGIELSADLWGRYGSAVEITRGLLDFGFSTLGLREIFGETTDENHRAARLASFLGACLETTAGPENKGNNAHAQPVIWRFRSVDWRFGAGG